MGGADGFAPGICAVGVDVFVLGEVQGLGRGFGRDRRGSRARKRIYHRGHGDRSTEPTESYCAALQSAAVAAGGKGEGTQRGTVLGAIGGHGSSPEKED